MKSSNQLLFLCASTILVIAHITNTAYSQAHDVHSPADLEDAVDKEIVDAHGIPPDPDEYDDVPREVDEHHPEAHWGYHGSYGPANWSMLEKACASTNPRQSPINIITADSKYMSTLTEIELVTDTKPGDHITIENNGHSVSLTYDATIHMQGGDLPSLFRVAGVHFHWGNMIKYGSEHTISDKHFPLEMHIVTYDEAKYAAVGSAVHGNNSLAVLGLIFQISHDDNPDMDPIISSLVHIPYPENETSIPHFDLTNLLPPGKLSYYYRYLGSLTTPPCAESVIWTVLKTYSTISESQLAKFQLLLEDDHHGHFTSMTSNWRPTQPLHGRQVYRSFPVLGTQAEPEMAENADERNNASLIQPLNIATICLLSLVFTCKTNNIL